MGEAGERHTVKNGTREEGQELQEHVLLLGGDFVPAEALAARLDIVGRDTLLDVGVEPLLGDNAGILVITALLAALPELQRELLACDALRCDERRVGELTCHDFFFFLSSVPSAASSWPAALGSR